MDSKEREEKVAQVKEQIAKLEDVNVEALSDEDLESVSGGCSVWCCTAVAAAADASSNP
jgi:hypothetical protein